MINLNINSDDSNLNDFLYTWSFFKKRPNQLMVNYNYSFQDFSKIINLKNININSELISFFDSKMISNAKFLSVINDNIFISYVILEKGSGEDIVVDLTFFYKEDDDIHEINNILEKLETCLTTDESDLETNKDNNKFSIIGVDNSILKTYDLEYEVGSDFVNFYNKKTLKNISKLIKSIKSRRNGLSLFIGDRGMGKTSIIKNKFKELNKKVFFIPNNMIEITILNPEFINFIVKNNDCVLVIDDFEIFIDNYSKYNHIINSLVQMVDGPISNVINVNILLIVNNISLLEIEEIIECNNIIDVVEFEYLTELEADLLYQHLKIKSKHNKKNRISDIISNKEIFNKKRLGF